MLLVVVGAPARRPAARILSVCARCKRLGSGRLRWCVGALIGASGVCDRFMCVL